MERRMLGKAVRGRKSLQMLSNVTSKTYEDLKLETRAGERKDCHKPATWQSINQSINQS